MPWLVVLAIAGMQMVRAQDEPVHMRPEFPLVFPLTVNGKDVTVKYPVMINPTTVLKPGMVLHVLYMLNHDSGGDSDLILAHKGAMDDAYARRSNGSGDGSMAHMDPQQAHEIEGYRRTKWEVPNNFVLAMAQYPTETMHLIYSPTGKHGDLDDERFSFFDGMFVGAPEGKVSVVAVEKESKAEKAGIKAGDDIVSVGNYGTKDDLASFASAYSAAKKDAKDNEVESFPLVIHEPGAAATTTVNLPMPPRIKSALMNDFFNQH